MHRSGTGRRERWGIVRFIVALVWISSIATANAGPVEDMRSASAALVAGDYPTAMRLFKHLADEGYPGGQFGIGVMYNEAKGVAQNYPEAMKWFRLAATKNHSFSQYEIGVMYDRGNGVAQDLAEAAKWYRLAAEQGYLPAQSNLGSMYLQGQGVPQNFSEAAKWCQAAANQGDPRSANCLGILYAQGKGVPKDLVEAYKWFYLAAAKEKQQGTKFIENRDRTASQLSPAQLSEAQRRANAWTPAKANQSASTDCADLNRQAISSKAVLQAATEEYKNSVASHLRETLNDSPPINVISEGVAAATKMISALDKTIDYLRSVLNAGCFGKDANAWSGAIAKMENQRDEMRRDRKTYIDILSMMAKGEEKPRK